ncbi:MAG: hypothetical protein FWC39_06055 [Bacteroidetes bacterium]|nr:hypothetical protein [Bacteroidota bacterium]
MSLAKQNNFEELVNSIYQTHCFLQSIDIQNNILPLIAFPEKSQTVSGFLETPVEKNIWLTASAKSEDTMNKQIRFTNGHKLQPCAKCG